MYDGTPLAARYAPRRPEASTGAEIAVRVLLGSFYGLTVVAILAAYYLIGTLAS